MEKGIIALLVLGLSMLVADGFWLLNTYRLTRIDTITQGTVTGMIRRPTTSTSSQSSDFQPLHPIIVFQTKDEKTIEFTSRIGSNLFAVGQSVNVIYPSSNPQDARVYGPFGIFLWLWPGILGFFGLVIVGMSFIMNRSTKNPDWTHRRIESRPITENPLGVGDNEMGLVQMARSHAPGGELETSWSKVYSHAAAAVEILNRGSHPSETAEMLMGEAKSYLTPDQFEAAKRAAGPIADAYDPGAAADQSEIQSSELLGWPYYRTEAAVRTLMPKRERHHPIPRAIQLLSQTILVTILNGFVLYAVVFLNWPVVAAGLLVIIECWIAVLADVFRVALARDRRAQVGSLGTVTMLMMVVSGFMLAAFIQAGIEDGDISAIFDIVTSSQDILIGLLTIIVYFRIDELVRDMKVIRAHNRQQSPFFLRSGGSMMLLFVGVLSLPIGAWLDLGIYELVFFLLAMKAFGQFLSVWIIPITVARSGGREAG